MLQQKHGDDQVFRHPFNVKMEPKAGSYIKLTMPFFRKLQFLNRIALDWQLIIRGRDNHATVEVCLSGATHSNNAKTAGCLIKQGAEFFDKDFSGT